MSTNNIMPAPSSMTKDALQAFRKAGFSRRDFFKTAGVLVIGFNAGNPEKAAAQNVYGGPPYPVVPLNQTDSWIAIAADETVYGYSGKCDFGQGFRTVQTQLIAEELNVPIDRINLTICDTAFCPDQGVSSGSQGTPTQFGANALRQALATARGALMKMAADQLKAPRVNNWLIRSLDVNESPERVAELLHFPVQAVVIGQITDGMAGCRDV